MLRATRVPPSFTALDLQELLSPASPDAIVVHSLQLDAGSDDSQVATISSNVSGSGNPGSNIDLGAKGGFGPVVLDSFFLGITVLASPSKNANISMDIIAVPGLNGHAFGSWKERNGEFMWLRDGLPETLQRSRIMIYGYDAKLDGSSSYATISNYGKSLLHDVVLARKDSPGRLLVFLAHSLGGLLVKEAIVYASRDESNGNEVLKALHGLVFIGVPHRGLKVEHLMAMVENQPNQKLVEALEPESFHLQTLHESFVHAIKSARPKVYSWFETAESNTVIKVGNSWKTEGPPARLVSQSSATHATSYEEPGDQYPMNLSHSEMIKFSISQVYYKQLRAQLEDLENSIAT